jgi:hypothetical protein
MADHFTQKRDFSSLSVKDLLEARDAYHVHLAHLRHAVATAIGRFRIRATDEDALDPDATQAKREDYGYSPTPRTLENSVVTKWSWPCILVFVNHWMTAQEMADDPDQVVPRRLHLPDGRVVPTCTILAKPDESEFPPAQSLIFPTELMGGGFPLLTEVQGEQHLGSAGCLVTDGNETYALTNRHVTGKPGSPVYALLRGRRQLIGVSDGKQIGKKGFGDIYPGWPGTRAYSDLDVGLVRVEDVKDWTAQVYGIGIIDDPIDLNTDTISLDLIGCPVRAYGCASGPLRGEIQALFYRYRSVGGFDYVADLLIGPRTTPLIERAKAGTAKEGSADSEVGAMLTRPGDSGTLWFFDEDRNRGAAPQEARQAAGVPEQVGTTTTAAGDEPDVGEAQAAERPQHEGQPPALRLRPIALQWGGHRVLSTNADKNLQFALATCLSTICRDLDVEVIRGWNIGQSRYWGKIGHYKIGAKACLLVSTPGLRDLMRANLRNIAFNDDLVRLGSELQVETSVFVPLADVPDYIWRNRRRRQVPEGEHQFPDHFADMDERASGGPYAGRHLFDLCQDPAMVDAGVWARFYDSLDKSDNERGILPFRVWQMYDAMVEFLRAGDVGRFVGAAGIVAHYVGDACQPLHGSQFHDGFPNGSRGVHTAYETTLLERKAAEVIDGINTQLAGVTAGPSLTFLSGLPGNGVRVARSNGGYKAAVSVVELMRKTRAALSPRQLINVYDSLRRNDRLINGWHHGMWDAVGGATVSIMADGCLCLAQIWESAWREGRGSDNINDLGAINRQLLRSLYYSNDFLADVWLSEIEATGLYNAP